MKREKINEVKITMTAKSENESLARAYVSLLLTQLDPQVDELADVRCAVSEAVTNCVVHGYRGSGEGLVYINAKLFSDRCVTVEITDKGCGIDDVQRAMKPLYTTDPAGERSGMGFSIMQSFTDKIRVRSAPGKGTRVFMTKKLS